MRELEIHSKAPLDGGDDALEVYLSEACGDDGELRGRVERLIEADRQAGSGAFMEALPFEGGREPEDGGYPPGSVVGNYKLLQLIGEGAFGVVYMADQLRPVKRRVAVKIIKLGMDTCQVVARFEVERQALAMMDHPNIAKVHDAGATESGRPYFVMELVRGMPITKFCEEQKMDTRARLALFVDVCSAVQHAHQKGIIHRDLKPSNVIVTLHDDKAVPKVIDFGVAKATQQDLTQRTLFTRFEQFIGTPAYMSPEQAEMSGLDIDTRSDIYALGVLLYELLTGTTPLDSKTLTSVGQDEMRRVIREEEPPRPSVRLTELQGRANRTEGVERGRIPSTKIDRDLDWVVMKALEKDRKRRYETANGLAADVRRYLADEPVEAGAPSVTYRLGKYVRRHRVMVATAGVVGTTLALATAVSTAFFFSERESKQSAEVAEARAMRTKLEAQHGLAEELLGAGKTALGMAKLAQLVREDEMNLVAAGRLMSAVQMREFARILQQFPIAYSPDFSPDGSLVATTTEDEKGFQVWDVKTGDPVGKRYSDPPGYLGRDFRRSVRFHPVEPWLLTEVTGVSPKASCVAVWNYETGEVVGEPVIFEGHTYFAEFSPSGEFVIAGGDTKDKETRVTRSRTGELVHSVSKSPNGNAMHGLFSPTEEVFAIVKNQEVTVYDAGTGEELRSIRHPSGMTIWKTAFSPDGARIATASEDQTARLWDVASGEAIGEPFVHGGRVDWVEFSHDGELLVTTADDGRVHVWNLANGKAQIGPIKVEGALKSAHFHPRRNWLVTVDDRRVSVWDAATGRAIGDALSRLLSFNDAVFSPGGEAILTSGPGGRCHLLETPTARPRCQEFHHPANPNWTQWVGMVSSANFSPDGSVIVSGGADGAARVWAAESGEPLRALRIGGKATWVDFSPDGSLVLAARGGTGGMVRVWEMDTWEQLSTLGLGDYCGFATFLPPSRDGGEGGDWRVMSAPIGAPPKLWSASSESALATFDTTLRSTKTMVDAVAASPDGRLVATLSAGSEVLVWDAESAELVRRLDGDFGQEGHGDFVRSVSFSSDGERILTTSNDDTARVWETATGRQLFWPPVRHGDDVTYATFSPGDGKYFATASRDSTARVWETATGEAVGVPMQHGTWVNHVAFDPSGKRLITACDDGLDRVWDAATGFPLSETLEHGGMSQYACFSPDGNQALTVGADAKVRLWEVPPVPERAVPGWVVDWIEAVVGLRFDESGSVTQVGWQEPERLQAWALEEAEGDGFYGRFVRWFYESPETRVISPFSGMSRDGYLANRMGDRTLDGEPVIGSLEDVLRIDPEHPAALLALAETLASSTTGDGREKLERARYYARVAAAGGGGDGGDGGAQQLSAEIERRLGAMAVERRIGELEALANEALAGGDPAGAEALLRKVARERIEQGLEDGVAQRELEDALRPWLELVGSESPVEPLVEAGSEWSYLDAEQPLPGDGWAGKGFDDGGWARGVAPLGFSKDGEDGEVTRLEGGERMTFYFRRRFSYEPVAMEGMVLRLRLRRDDGAVVYLNGIEVVRSNMPAGEIGPSTPAAGTAGTKTEADFVDYRVDPALLVAGENVLAVEVHQVKLSSSDMILDAGLGFVPDPLTALRQGGGDDFLYGAAGSVALEEASVEELEKRARVQWLLGDPAAAIEALEHGVARLEGSVEAKEVRQRGALLRRKADVLAWLGRTDEARALRDRVAAVWERAPGTPAGMVDLGDVYTEGVMRRYTPARGSANDWTERLPETFDPGDGPAFDIRGFVRLNSGVYGEGNGEMSGKDHNVHYGTDLGMSARIGVGTKAQRVHFLHGCSWGAAKLGEVVASYVLHFEDGSSERVPVRYGQDILNFWIHYMERDGREESRNLVWAKRFSQEGEENGKLGLARMTWENGERADQVITHIEFVSEAKEAAPFLLGITLE